MDTAGNAQDLTGKHPLLHMILTCGLNMPKVVFPFLLYLSQIYFSYKEFHLSQMVK